MKTTTDARPLRSLTCSLALAETLSGAETERMYVLMTRHYTSVTRTRFRRDLSGKQWALLLRDDTGRIQGFSTVAVNPCGCGGDDYNILYSGDTIIDREYWGTQELVRGFCSMAGALKAGQPRKRLYWYLLSKGHRTYMYLSLFCRKYFPAPNPARRGPGYAAIADRSSQILFPDHWRPDRGVIIFPERVGEVTDNIAIGTWQRRSNPHVAFFIDCNPGFADGDELVCLAELSLENLRSRSQRIFREGMRHPLRLGSPSMPEVLS